MPGLLGDNTSDQYAGLLTDQFYKDIPLYLNYFTKQWLSDQPGTKMAYLEGWQPEVANTNYNMPLAFLMNIPQAINWEDVGPAGARWHGSDRTPFGDWLKSSWSPEKYGYWDAETAQEESIKAFLKRLQAE